MHGQFGPLDFGRSADEQDGRRSLPCIQRRQPAQGKNWSEFTNPGAPEFDFIFTVCDNAAGESCPVWLGKPLTAHWGVEDPAAVEGDGQRQAFVDALSYLKRRIELFLMLPLQSIDEMSVRSKLAAIGREEGASAKAKES